MINKNDNVKIFKSLLKNIHILERIFIEKTNLQRTEHDPDKKLKIVVHTSSYISFNMFRENLYGA